MKFFLCMLAMAASALAQAASYSNPILWQDLADLEIIRVNDTFYYTASTMHYSPGAPVLRSYNLVDWEYVGHSVPELIFGERFYLNGSGTAYVGGIWASSIAHRESNGLFYWYGCDAGGQTWVFTATDPAGPWASHAPLPKCYYDLGVLVDDDDTMYMAYGAYDISVVQLSPDGMSAVREQKVFSNGVYLEGSRFYKIGCFYYIWLTVPANQQHVLRSSSPWGPYEEREILVNMAAPIPHSGVPHQGGIIDTPKGDWYYMGFLDAYPLGRIPVLAPLAWEDGWPRIVTDEGGGWGATYPMPDIQTDKTVRPAGPYTDRFEGNVLGPEWEWNHNPDDGAWSLAGPGLVLETATVTDNLHLARNTLSHRIAGPRGSGTFRLDVGGMLDGDVAGVAMLRDESAYIGVRKQGDGLVLEFVRDLVIEQRNGVWEPISTGEVAATAEGVDLSGVAAGDGSLWLRVVADVTPNFRNAGAVNTAWFEYSTDGEVFRRLGAWRLHQRWEFFMAYRFAVFNFATERLGGRVVVEEFALGVE